MIPQALLKMDCQGLVVRLIQDFVLLTTAVEVAQRWRELAEKLAKVSKQQMDAYEAPHRDKSGVVDSEVRADRLWSLWIFPRMFLLVLLGNEELGVMKWGGKCGDVFTHSTFDLGSKCIEDGTARWMLNAGHRASLTFSSSPLPSAPQAMWKPAYDFLLTWSSQMGDSYRDVIQDLHTGLDKMKNPITKRWKHLTGTLILVNSLDMLRAAAFSPQDHEDFAI